MKENRKLSCLIIEDEPIAAEVLSDYINQVAFLELRGICTDALFALDKLKQDPIDVIFLDIHLPKLKGLDFLKILKNLPQTILTTAYHQYALDAFEADVVDYLLKPIGFSRFLKAVNRLKGIPGTPAGNEADPVQNQVVTAVRPFRFFNVNKKMVKVFYDEILYIESLKDYSRIHTASAALVTRGQIGEMEAALTPRGFLRIHRSFIVSLDKVEAFSATTVEVGGKTLPIGRNYRISVNQKLEGLDGFDETGLA